MSQKLGRGYLIDSRSKTGVTAEAPEEAGASGLLLCAALLLGFHEALR